MNSVVGIALITLRNAVRSKVVWVLLLLLFATIIGLPLTLKGDGTIQSYVLVLMRYTLGLSMFILSVATLWTACGTVSTDIRDRQIQLVRAKPVSAFQIWAGKWLGLLILNALLLALCFVSTYTALRWTTRPGALDSEQRAALQEEILVARRSLGPREENYREEVRRQYDAALKRGEITDEDKPAAVYPLIERRVRAQAFSITPGSFVRWTFDIPNRPPDDQPLILRYRFSLSVMDLEPIKGLWTIGALDSPHRMLVNTETPPQAWQHLTVSSELIAPNNTLTVEFANVHDRPITVVFNPDTGIQLMVYEGGFAANYLRAALLILWHLAFLAAVGVTAGTFFSMPVAILTSIYALIVLNAGSFITSIAQSGADWTGRREPLPFWGELFAATVQWIYRILDFLVRPVYAVNPLEQVAVGEWISWMSVGYMFSVKVLLYGGVLALLGAWHLAHKEVALPS